MTYQYHSEYGGIPIFRRNDNYYVFLEIADEVKGVPFRELENLENLIDFLSQKEELIKRLPTGKAHPLYELFEQYEIEDE